jgi:RNA-directed DNA polymerase
MMVDKMALDLGLTRTFIAAFSRGASHAYKFYTIAKRTGGERPIHHPSKQLKSMQRWLLAYVIEPLPVHPAATAYRKGRSILDNARVHAASKFLLRMDCDNFFPSITQDDVLLYIQQRPTLFPGWTPFDIDVFCKLICREGRLTIGAPTSPGISNALCYELDSALSDICLKRGVNYSRYADDLFFSASKPDVLRPLQPDIEQIVTDLKLPAALKINPAKTRHSSKRGRRRATGIILGSDGQPHIGRAVKRRIRSLIHGVESLDPTARRSLAGLVSYAAGFGPDFMDSLIIKYGHSVMQKVRFPT